MKREEVIFTPRAGLNMKLVIAEAIAYAKTAEEILKKKCTAKFECMDVIIYVRPDSDPELIYRDYCRAFSGYIRKTVGPSPNLVLTNEERVNDTRIEMENELRRQQFAANYEAVAVAKRKSVEAKLVGAPGIQLKNVKAWQRLKRLNSDNPGSALITYAEQWARLMQVGMATGKKLEDVAEATSYEANDLVGMSGLGMAVVVIVLSEYWVHGKQLSTSWHY